jgi:CRISPR-associated protein Cmr2
MKKYLFLFTIGPVQSFIVQARKTRDLYSGSQILSDLIKFAIEKVGAENIVFPYPQSEHIPNRFLAIVEKDKSELEDFGKSIEDAVKASFEENAIRILNDKVENYTDDFRDMYLKQISQHLEVYWVFKPIDNDDYTNLDYQRLEQIMGAVKAIRPFVQHSEVGHKCNLDGERNALFFGKRSNRNYISQNKAIELSESEIQIKSNEGLSAVSFMKRFYKMEEERYKSFPSVAKVSLLYDISEISKLENIEKGKEVFMYKNIFLSETGFDEELFFEENLTQAYFNKNGYKKLIKIKRQHEKIKPFLKTRYYAILTFDGDNMGKWMNGDYLKAEYRTNIKQYHTELSKKLSDFAKEAKRIVDSNHGKTIYAGGDDFMAFINIYTFLDVLEQLQKTFKTMVSDEIQNFLEQKKELTFSTGICIAHYKEPLRLVLGMAHEMQQKAKNVDTTKERFAINVIKGAGQQHQFALSNQDKSGSYNADILQKIINKIGSDDFSDTFIRSLQKNFHLLHETIQDGYLLVEPKLFQTEIKRLVRRSCQIKNKSKKEKSELSDDFYDLLIRLYKQDKNVDNFFDLLNICNFIIRITKA